MRANSGDTQFVTLTPYQEVIHKTRYAKWNEAEKRRETLDETIRRYLAYFNDYLSRHYHFNVLPALNEELFVAMRNLGVQPSMRALMTAGVALESAQMASYNCTYMPIDAIESFSEMMYILMTGSGVGFSVERANVNKLPDLKPYDSLGGNVHVIVADSREGWCDAYGHILDALYAGRSVTWDTSRVRPKGSRLNTFGGYSSGPEPLEDLFRHTTDIFAEALVAGQTKLRPKQVFSLCTMIAQIVVVGGVRRSATICLFDKDDVEMLNAKGADSQMYVVENGEWKPGPNAHYAMANISAVFEETPTEAEFKKFWSTLREGGFGEPGIFNRAAVRAEMDKIGRPNHYKDGTPIAWGVNPCCVAAGTLVDTTRGQVKIEHVKTGDEVLIDGTAHRVVATLATGKKDCLAVRCADGTAVNVTPDHRILTTDGYKRADALSVNDKIVTSRLPVVELTSVDASGWLVGNCLGDGHIDDNHCALDYWGTDIDTVYPLAVARLEQAFPSNTRGPRKDSVRGVYRRVTSRPLRDAFLTVADETKLLNAEMLDAQPDDFVASLLRGWFDADGTVSVNKQKGISVRLGSTSYANLLTAKRALSRLGVTARVYEARSAERTILMPNGKGGQELYDCAAFHELVVSADNIPRFARAVGFDTPHKAARLTQACADVDFYHVGWVRVTDVVPSDQHEVYDLDVPTARAFVANGLVVHNCEIILRPYQACNLSSAVIRDGDTLDVLMKKVEQATILGTWQAAVTRFQYLRPIWRENIEEEALLGVCLSGFYDHELLSQATDESARWLRTLQDHAWMVNAAHAAAIGINPATSVTAVKPSGNSGELADSASGIHPRYSKYYVRTVRQSTSDPMTAFLEASGVPCEVSLQKSEDRVFSFPIKAPAHAVTVAEVSALRQLDHWLHVKQAWATHTVSCSIYVKPDEWDAVEAWVFKHFDQITGLSFFPYFENNFKQAPFQQITLDEYNALIQNGTTSIDWSLLKHFESQDSTATGQEFTCIGGACTL